MSLNNSIVTQSIGIPYQQYVTSSAGHTLVSSSTYFNDTSDNLPRYKDANGLVYDPFITSSYALTSSFAQSGDGIFSGSFSGSYVGDGSQFNRGRCIPLLGLSNHHRIPNSFRIHSRFYIRVLCIIKHRINTLS
jgi:hypothetical protein